MSNLTGITQVAGQKIFSSSSNQLHTLGELMVTPDGRKFRYARAGASALVPGTLVQAPAQTTGVQDLTPTATAIGALEITTSSTVTVTANQFAGGYVLVTVTPGQGYQYRIKSHPAATSAAVTLTLEDPIQVALTTSSRIDLVANPYNGVIINPSTATSSPVGVAVFPIAASGFGWVQTGGPANILADGAITVGINVIASNATAGAVEAGADAADLQASVGIALTGIATTEYGAIQVTLD